MIFDGDIRIVYRLPALSIKLVAGELRHVARNVVIAVKEAPDSPFKDGVVLTETYIFYIPTKGVSRINDMKLNSVVIG